MSRSWGRRPPNPGGQRESPGTINDLCKVEMKDIGIAWLSQSQV